MSSDPGERPSQFASVGAAIEAELQADRLDLAFPPFLESRYQQDQQERRCKQLRHLSLLGLTAYGVLSLVLKFILPETAGWMILGLHWVCVGAITGGAQFLFRPTRPFVQREAAAFAPPLAEVLSLTLLVVTSGAAISSDALMLTTLAVVALPLLTLLPIRRAAMLAAASLVIYAALLLTLAPFPWGLRLFPIGVAIVLTLPALFALHRLERASRRLYLHELLQKAQGERSAAFTDPLTGLPNRERMGLALSALCEQDEVRASFLMLDIDLFQDVNDQYGHQTGDRLLNDLGRCLSAALRDGDLLARLGGEEFGVLLNGLVMQDAILVAERLRAAVAAFPFMVGTKLIKMTVSIGVTGIVPCDEPTRILDSAEKGMHLAKRAGRNQVGGPWLKMPS
jgi:diguanylate cyclase (GGDEF)-like protein